MPSGQYNHYKMDSTYRKIHHDEVGHPRDTRYMEWTTQLTMIGQIALAGLLGGMLGLERELRNKSAGLRTHILVTAAVCGLVLLAEVLVKEYQADGLSPLLTSDPVRIIQAIVIGISFIGGGAILKDSQDHVVYNLTTATTLFFSALVGLSVAVHFYVLATALTLFALVVNFAILKLERGLRTKE